MIRFDNHAFRGLDHSLKQLFEVQVAMGGGIRAMMGLMQEALEKPDIEKFAAAKQIDKTINDAEMQAEQLVADIIAKFNVSGDDLRFILGSIKVSGTLERVADKTKNCIKRLGKITHALPPEVKTGLAAAMQSVDAMIDLALEQVVDYSEEKKRELLRHGAIVQQSYKGMLLHLHAHTHEAADETHITLISKNLEQAADMLVEIMKVGHVINFGAKYEKESI